MNTLNKTLIAVSLSLFAVAPAFASHDEHRLRERDPILERLEHQRHRIHQGVERHQLTRREARMLWYQHREIRRMARRFYEDGVLSKKERRWLDRELRVSSLRIQRMKRNELNRYVELHQRYGHHNRASSL